MTIRAIVPALIAGTAISLLSPALRAADAVSATDLPIKRITLYRSGVGSFERRASVDGDKHFALRFETGQINDILKTMVLLDPEGGKIGAVSYPSNDPLSRRLAGFGVDISKSPAIDELFRQLRGEKLKITTGGNAVEGTILNVEQRPAYVANAAGEQTTHLEWYVNLVTATGAIKSFAIPQIGGFELSDPKLAEELGKALAAVAEQRAEHSKTVELSFNGPAGKQRPVTVAYVHEMPVWKASYRLVLPEDQAKDAKAKGGVLQGWAIVENTTDTDWDGVNLSLASGRPVSFTMDLYEPIYGSRPAVPVPVMGGIMPRVYEDGMRAMRSLAAAGGAPAAPASMVANQVAESSRMFKKASAEAADAKSPALGYAYLDTDGNAAGSPASAGVNTNLATLDASFTASAQASGGDAGEQFLYTVSAPVSIARQRSAMIPIIGADIDAKRVSIYNPNDNLKNPMRGVRLTNSTGLHLMPGPLAVFDAGTYAGDAQIPHTARNAQRLLAYALDLDVAARSEAKTDSTVVKIIISDGTIRQSVVHRSERTYYFDNHDPQRGRTVVIEHPRTGGYELAEPKKADETTDALYRFETPINADKPAEFKVAEEFKSVETLGVTDMNMETLLVYAKNGKASAAVVDAVKKAAAMQSEINATKNQIVQLQVETNEISQDQSRVRDNMGRIERNSELYGRYMKKLNEQEDRLEKIKADLEKLRAQQTKQETALRDFLTKLNVE